MSSTTVDMGKGWINPEPTEIEGIIRVGKKGTPVYEGGEGLASDWYVVHFEATIEADTVEQASDRAMQLRSWLDEQEWLRREPDFYWHLHDHDGC